jgi:hypothetical protein
MPALLRLDVMTASTELGDRTLVDLASIRNSLMHLQHLADGLNLLSAETVGHSDTLSFTRLDDWWAGLRGILAEALPAETELTTSFAPDLPAAAISPAALAQVVASIVLMTAQAVAEMPTPRVSIRAALDDDEECLHLEIEHNGGLSAQAQSAEDEHLSRFGLATCRTLMQRFGGDLRVEATSTGGTIFHLQLGRAAADRRHPPRVRVLVSDPRALAVVRMILIQRRVTPVPFADDGDVDTIICDAASLPIALRSRNPLADNAPSPTIIALGPPQDTRPGVRWIDTYDTEALSRAFD